MHRYVVCIKYKYIHFLPCRLLQQLKFRTNYDFIDQINKKQSLWKATAYRDMEAMTLEDLVRRAGGRKSKIIGSALIPILITLSLPHKQAHNTFYVDHFCLSSSNY